MNNSKSARLTYQIQDQDHLLNLFTHLNRHLTLFERAIDTGFLEHPSHNNSTHQQNQLKQFKHNQQIQNIKKRVRFEDFETYFQRSLPPPTLIPTQLIGEICSICYENYLPQQTHYRLNCQHHFHQNCLEEWFKSHQYSLLICPLCRYDHSS